MSVCRGRLLFSAKSELRSQESGLARTLNFAADSDSEEQHGDFNSCGFQEDCSSSPSSNRTPTKNDVSDFWDSGLCSPTPGCSPRFRHSLCRQQELSSPLSYRCEDSDIDDPSSPITSANYTPPHKKFHSLRLNDTPHTPKSLLQRANRRTNTKLPKGKGVRRLALDPLGPQANVNPFTPQDNRLLHCTPRMLTGAGLKRSRHVLERLTDDSMEEDIDEEQPKSKKLALHEINTSRYNEEFHQVCKLGVGEFGSVYKCINRLDGCTYAIKKSKTPVAGSSYERTALNEVYAHAVLGKHPHVVRYYSAWAENDHMYIQNEFCNGGSLADVMAEQRARLTLHPADRDSVIFPEKELKKLTLHLAQGLKYIHSQGLVHLDIKPGNVFIQRPVRQESESGLEEDMGDEEQDDDDILTYKIGDLGHVTSTACPLVEEGDCRYLSREILHEQFSALPKADVFSMALTVYEAATLCDLPKNGDAWHAIRRDLPNVPGVSDGFNSLLKLMTSEDPSARPRASTLVHHPSLSVHKTRSQLRRELNEERFKNQLLAKQLEAAQKKVLAPVGKHPRAAKSLRLIGRSYNRSMSTTNF